MSKTHKYEETKIEHSEFSSVLNTILFNIKFLFANKNILLTVGLFYIIAFTLPIIFLPVYLSGGVMLLTAIIMPTLVILGALGSNLKKSTLYKNVFTTGMKKTSFYIAQLVTTIIVINLISLIFWCLFAFIGLFHIFLGGWVWESAERINVNPFAHYEFVLLFYITNVTGALLFAFYFLIDSIVNNAKSYNLIITSVFIIGIIFGGSMNGAFSKPLHYGWYQPADGGGINGIDYVRTSFNGPIYVTYDFYIRTNELNDCYTYFNSNGIEPHGGLLPNFMIAPTLVFNPFYGVGEFTTTAITRGMTPEYSWHMGQQIIVVENLSDLDNSASIEMFSNYSNNISIFSWFRLNFHGDYWMWTMVVLQPFIAMFTYVGIGAVIRKIKR